MALKQDAHELAADLRDYAQAITKDLRDFADTVEKIATLIPSPDDFANGNGISDEDAERLADDAETYTLMPPGWKIGRRDRNGKKLRSGDRVRVTDSARYDTTLGTVIGPGPNFEDGKERVLVRLDDAQNDRYTPSTGRVERILRYDNQINEDPGELAAVRFGPLLVGIPRNHPLGDLLAGILPE